ncbi:OprD family porin [Metapseudomonas resinovorans]|uniref:Putative proline-specific porin OpdB n=1 Tax=Metapseudomonas resinovorans NBRC 106553 TaxID=1245471 RepID=S6ADC0_METRE|nr:OprD family porin [Pseudomonas resinovorans]BAN47137.1 putative proline-specific porin OpdB [Pseudomonas resinovorans NBRC 106553]
MTAMPDYKSLASQGAVLLGSVLLTLPMSAAAEEGGFFDDDSLTLLNRNYYFNRSAQDGRPNRRDWSHGLMLDYSSGFTRGTVGFGLDAFAYLGLKLDASPGKSGTFNLSIRDDGSVADDYGKAGAALKLRVSATELRIGEQHVDTPVFAVGHNRLIPQTATGVALDSRELKGLTLQAGHFTSATGHVTTGSDGDLWALYAGVTTPSVDYAGGRYQFSPDLSASLYTARFEDIWNQYYLELAGSRELDRGRRLGAELNLYRSLDTGRARAGSIDNTTLGLSGWYQVGAQRFTLAMQNIDGNTPFDFLAVGAVNRNGQNGRDKAGPVRLPNAVQYSDFNGPNERSWQLRYDLDMAAFGAPGLNLMGRWLRGSGIDGTHLPANSPYAGRWGDGGKHRETNLEARYVVQSGAAKGLSFRLRQTWHRGNPAQGEGNIDEFRVITDYPLDLI